MEWEAETTRKLEQMARSLEISNDHQSEYDIQVNKLIELSSEIKAFVAQSWKADCVEIILKSLHFDQIRERQSRVAAAHRATFGWVFDADSPSTSWLREGHGIYWIEGKAGSGKSILMKNLLQHQETETGLRQWAGSGELFIGSHFFWITGTEMQKSQAGLLRTMLFQLLRKHPALIRIVCPDRFSRKAYDHLDSWTMEELLQCFELLIVRNELRVRMCFFVDGLGEYKGDHTELIKLLGRISAADHIKMCVSRRPWPEFREAYGSSPWTLRVHKFTKHDIRTFAQDRLGENRHFSHLRMSSRSEAEGLMEEITLRSEGVFLLV